MTRRYAPDRTFPPYRYVPGRTPHPVRDPRGHARGVEVRIADFEPSHWQTHETWLHAIDLFNHGYYWEAHEAIEAIWVQVGRDSPTGVYLQGLIQCSAALLKHAMGEATPAAGLAARGGTKLRSQPAGFLGFDGHALAARVESHVAGGSDTAPTIRLDESALDAPG